MQLLEYSGLFAWMIRHWIVTFLAMTVFFVGSGLASYNLIKLFAANASFFARHGLAAVMYGGLTQTAQLTLFALLAVGFYFLFKFSENALIERFAYRKRT